MDGKKYDQITTTTAITTAAVVIVGLRLAPCFYLDANLVSLLPFTRVFSIEFRVDG